MKFELFLGKIKTEKPFSLQGCEIFTKTLESGIDVAP